MNAAGPAVPPSVPPRRMPPWWVVLACLGGLLVLGGALLVLLHPAEASFGWFAGDPLDGAAFPAVTLVTPEAAAGWAGLLAGFVLWAFCAGWLVGRRGPAPRR